MGRKEAGSGPPVNVGPAVAGPADLPAGRRRTGRTGPDPLLQRGCGPYLLPGATGGAPVGSSPETLHQHRYHVVGEQA